MKRNLSRSSRSRNRLGVGFFVLTFFVAVFVILPAGLLAFELARYNLLAQELSNVTDAAALAGSAAMVSAPRTLSLPSIHNLAIESALITFEQNSVGSTKFSPSNVTLHANSLTSEPPKQPYQATLNVALLDNQDNMQSVGSTLVKKLRVHSLYKDKPAFAYFLNLDPTMIVSATANGGLPKLDVFICFDASGSMDDQTEVSLLRRYWNANERMVDYKRLANGTIYDLFKPPPTGTALNAFWPQNLSYGSYGGQDANGSPWVFSEGPQPAANKMNRLRCAKIPKLLANNLPFKSDNSLPEQGQPPGNYDPKKPGNSGGNGVEPEANPTGYTDLIVKVPNNAGYLYPNLATCLEASRGNLESKKAFDQSRGGENTKINPELQGVTPKPGYYANYWTQVQQSSQPISDVRSIVLSFLDSVNQSADAHFGVDVFSDTAGENPGDYWKTTSCKIDGNYAAGGSDLFPTPLINLDQQSGKYPEIISAFQGTSVGNIEGTPDNHRLAIGATGKTNIAAPLHVAIEQLADSGKSRHQAKKAIVLFTDGVANEPFDIYSANSAAMKEAQRACQAGIPIYTIGFSQNNDVKPLEDKLLGDGKHGSGMGIAYASGNHATYTSVHTMKDLKDCFQTIARSLVVLRQNK
ncbi:MAG: hypothetical protein C5B53_04425 [Candidatus Melainabacteria bacterium]|nr:MAG: hypothetical protein C5B53_04425 [Candidatus Melainabacteria bacterium]